MTIFKFLKLIKYIGKEKVYSFGRIDLYGVNKDNNNICIELKKRMWILWYKTTIIKVQRKQMFW